MGFDTSASKRHESGHEARTPRCLIWVNWRILLRGGGSVGAIAVVVHATVDVNQWRRSRGGRTLIRIGREIADLMLIDLHVHSVKSSDSSLSFEHLAREARRVGLDGVCLTEHDVTWDWAEIDALSLQHGIRAFPAMEVSTEWGHIAVFGLRAYRQGMARVAELRRIVQGEGGFMVAMHPFRRLYEKTVTRHPLFEIDGDARPSVAEAAAHALFQLVDDIEVGNGANSVQENTFACDVADWLGHPGTAGSDAHSIHGLGCFATRFESHFNTPEALVRELHARRYMPIQGLLEGNPRHLVSVNRMAVRAAEGSNDQALLAHRTGGLS
jgi:predicted metal-dependent phosphoesterase TrpH